MKKTAEAEITHFELIDGILIGTYKEDRIEITLEVAKEVVKQRLRFLKDDKSYPILIYGKGIISVSKDARDYFASKESIRGITAAALVADSKFSQFLSIFFLNLTKPSIPTQIFSDKEKAIEWLEQYK